MARIVILMVLVLGMLVIAYEALYFFGQRSLVFPAPRASSSAKPPDAKVVVLPGPEGLVEAWFLPPTSGSGGPAPLLLFTHGNAELIDDWADRFGPPREAGYAVLLVEYPGYGKSAGSPSEKSIGDAVLAAYDWARASTAVDPRRIIPYGRSLGGGAACIVAAQRPVAALILESSFTSVRSFARRYMVPDFLVRDPFDNLEALRSYHGPLLVLHGNSDPIIPAAHGQKLAAAVPRAEFELLPCGHNDCPRAWERVLTFLQEPAKPGD